MVAITPPNLSLLLPSSPDAAFYRERGLRDLKKALKAPRFEGKAKNVIVFVGDGLGVSTHTMSRIYKGQKNGRTGEEESLVWEDWDYSGLIKVSLLRPNQSAVVLMGNHRGKYSAKSFANCQHQMSPTVKPRGKGSSASTI